MNYLIAANSDVGIKRERNQDAICVEVADTVMGKLALAAVCDGMGGLSSGEYASESTISKLREWFREWLPIMVGQGMEASRLKDSLKKMICEQNEQLVVYGQDNAMQLGTTLSAILLLPDKYYAIHVGDSRIYLLNREGIRQITEDHSLVAKELRKGILTKRKAGKDKRRNILLQCVGARDEVVPDFIEGEVKEGDSVLLCSDGFVHKITEREMWKKLGPRKVNSESKMEAGLTCLTDLVKKRKETDNISSVLIHLVTDGK